MKKASPKTSNRSIAGSVFEGIKDLGSQTAKSAVDEFGAIAKGGAQSLIGRQFPSQSQNENSYDSGLGARMAAPERMGFPGLAHKKEKPREYLLFSNAEYQETLQTSEEIKRLVVAIKEEVRKIEAENRMMITETAKIAVEQLPEKPGVYHVRFFEWLLSLLRDVQKKVSESASWLSIARGKQKKGYWGMAKKKGTSFTLSGERTAATQSG